MLPATTANGIRVVERASGTLLTLYATALRNTLANARDQIRWRFTTGGGADIWAGSNRPDMTMGIKHSVIERVRCAKHNWLDGVNFRTHYRRGLYEVRTHDGLLFRFPFNPYTSFFEIGGYLAEGEWKLEPGMGVVDAGGERGEFALYAARRVGPQGRVIMLEPDPQGRGRAEDAFNRDGGRPGNAPRVEPG